MLGSTGLGACFKPALTFAGILAFAAMVALLARAVALAGVDAGAFDLGRHGSLRRNCECCGSGDCEGSGGEYSAGL